VPRGANRAAAGRPSQRESAVGDRLHPLKAAPGMKRIAR
jgi:hypothetical protein